MPGGRLDARECHFSFGSPSQKFASAQRGWGLPAVPHIRVSVGLDRVDNEGGTTYHEVRELDFRAQQYGCGTACSRQHLGHP
jgi:hypothetical protein